jgi:hypothetical protein
MKADPNCARCDGTSYEVLPMHSVERLVSRSADGTGSYVCRCMHRYHDWIEAYLSKQPHYDGWPSLYGCCTTATKQMVEAFPELRRVAGFANHREHFWCVAPDGEVIDPTVKQFFRSETEMREFPVEYREFQPGDEVRVGKCMNCGDPIYAQVERLDDPKAHRSVCSDECESALIAALG